MRILIHICCANCAIYPVQRIRERGEEVTGFFFNPNIHPYEEYKRRLDCLRDYSEKVGLKMIYRDEYLLEEFLKEVAHRVEDRCRYCYSLRLEATVREAKKGLYDSFSTTLLQSRHQNHSLIKETGEKFSKEFGVPFYYEDFREGWKIGLEASKAMGLYRQKYCGCIYSEKDRFLKEGRKQKVEGEKYKIEFMETRHGHEPHF